jgi:hypothetical protein
MLRFSLACALAMLGSPAFAENEKEVSCGYQADVVAAIRQARLDGVKERQVEKTILSGDPDWPENYSKAIPALVPWVYQMDIALVRDNDLSAILQQQCLDNWEQIQSSVGGLKQ